MNSNFSIRKVFAICLDGIGAFLLAIYSLILGPLGVLRGPLVFERAFLYLWVLAPLGMMSRSMRMMIDWRIGNFDVAISLAEDLATKIEEALDMSPRSHSKRRVLEDVYTLLARANMHCGRIDEAMVVVLRAKKKLGAERLPGLAELNAKTAHLVRAGLAAGRLLDGGGLATLFIKTPQAQNNTPASVGVAKKRQGASVNTGNEKDDENQGAVIIPFPHPDQIV
jgi:hypothetical protein